MVEWKELPGSDIYEISNDGRLRLKVDHPKWFRRMPAGIELKQRDVCGGSGQHNPKYPLRINYLTVDLYRRGRMSVHILVCTAFHGDKPSPKHYVAHFDGNHLNNNADNLRWATAAENTADKLRHGTVPRGDSHPRTKFGNIILNEASVLLKSGMLGVEVAKRFNMSQTHVSRIKHGTARASGGVSCHV